MNCGTEMIEPSQAEAQIRATLSCKELFDKSLNSASQMHESGSASSRVVSKERHFYKTDSRIPTAKRMVMEIQKVKMRLRSQTPSYAANSFKFPVSRSHVNLSPSQISKISGISLGTPASPVRRVVGSQL
jgi:hypothetical protein